MVHKYQFCEPPLHPQWCAPERNSNSSPRSLARILCARRNAYYYRLRAGRKFKTCSHTWFRGFGVQTPTLPEATSVAYERIDRRSVERTIRYPNYQLLGTKDNSREKNEVFGYANPAPGTSFQVYLPEEMNPSASGAARTSEVAISDSEKLPGSKPGGILYPNHHYEIHYSNSQSQNV